MSAKVSTPARTAILEQGLRSAFDYGVVQFRTGSANADPNGALQGTIIGYGTTDGGTFTPGSNTNGLRFAAASNGAIGKTGNWVITPIANGVAGHFVLCANAADDGSANNGALRITGTVGTSAADMIVGNTSFTVGNLGTIDGFTVRLPSL